MQNINPSNEPRDSLADMLARLSNPLNLPQPAPRPAQRELGNLHKFAPLPSPPQRLVKVVPSKTPTPANAFWAKQAHALTPNEFKIEKSGLLATEINEIINSNLEVIRTSSVPRREDISLAGGKKLESAVLYIDMRESTLLTETHTDEVAAKMYKVYLEGIVAIARYKSGHIRGFAGDKIMVLFDNKDGLAVDRAIDCAVWMQSFIEKKISPVLRAKFKHPIACGVGIDYGTYIAVRGGRKGNNDIIWAGKAANRASKYADNALGGEIIISHNAFMKVTPSAKKKFALISNTPMVFVKSPQFPAPVHKIPRTVRYTI